VKRAVLYLRTAVTGGAVENQRQQVEAAAQTRGLDVVGTYQDHASAAGPRPAFDQMLRDWELGAFDVVLVASLDRLGRSTARLLQTGCELQRRSLSVLSADGVDLDLDLMVRLVPLDGEQN
jgi:DNA invertase Pin-like site-specific DNA recombinase